MRNKESVNKHREIRLYRLPREDSHVTTAAGWMLMHVQNKMNETHLTVESQQQQHEEEERGPERSHRHQTDRLRIRNEGQTRTWNTSQDSYTTSSNKSGSELLSHTDEFRLYLNSFYPFLLINNQSRLNLIHVYSKGLKMSAQDGCVEETETLLF